MKVFLIFAYVIVSVASDVTYPATNTPKTEQSTAGEANRPVTPTTTTTTTTTTTIATTQLSVQTTKAVLKDQVCISNYGNCVPEDSSCTNDHSKVNGICTDKKEACCIPSQAVVKSWTEKDESCENIYGTCQLDTVTCDGVWGEATCGGPANRKCCSPGAEAIRSWIKNDDQCLEVLGVCQLATTSCDGPFQSKTCGGPAQRQCCLPSAESKKAWEKGDTGCHLPMGPFVLRVWEFHCW
nr:integumentary mucin C.1-like isoform X2 [Ciona intestinalis]|eukprot:XP_018670882.1 integumentary mucin C.1-like isoform X2 [Ciona intestinalis]